MPHSSSINSLVSTATILKVAVFSPLRKLFDYLPIPGEFPPLPGCRVRIPFGKQERIGIVVELSNETEHPLQRLKPISETLDTSPLFSSTMWQLLHWASDYYHWPLGEVCATAMPLALRQGNAAALKRKTCWQLTPEGLQLSLTQLARAPRQQAALVLFKENPDIQWSLAELKAQGISPSALQALLKASYIAPIENEIPPTIPATTAHAADPLLLCAPLSLNEPQQQSYLQIINCLGRFETLVLDGITGSGKTEVYLQAIEQVLLRSQQALVLVPEIGLTPQTVARFQARFNVPIAVIHSGLTEAQRLSTWLLAQLGLARIVIGTRSAAFVPMPHLGLCIIDEEHDSSFKQQEGFRYSARHLLMKRCQLEQIPIVLGSATPALETLHNAYVGRYHHLKIPIRAGLSSPPILEILDIRHKKLQEGLSYALIGQLEKHLNAGEQVLLFLNRRGFAPVLFCPECQWAAECKRCDARLTYHQASPQLRCHHCEAAYPLETMCPKCQNPDLIPLGMGTERIETFLKKKFPHKRVLRLDRDTSPSAKKVTLALDAIHKGEADILLGTQMIAKGHHFPRVTLVAILDIDAAFFSHDFRSLERIGQLIVQVAGRAGRAEKLGQVLLQTAQPEHPLLQTLLSQGYGAFAKALLTERHIAHLPPYSFHALLRCEARTLDSALNFLKKAKAKIHHFGSLNLKALGPVPSPMERCRNRYRAQLLLQASKRSQLNLLLKNIMPHLESQPRAQQLRWSLDIDPLDMF